MSNTNYINVTSTCSTLNTITETIIEMESLWNFEGVNFWNFKNSLIFKISKIILKNVFAWFLTSKIFFVQRISSMCRRLKEGQISRFSWFSSLRRPRTAPDCPRRFRHDPRGAPGPWESISDRLLPPQLLKAVFSLRNWSGRLCACKG